MKMLLRLLVLSLAFTAFPASAKESFRVAWSHYTGWEPWGYAEHAGILEKWADKYGIEIELRRMDYVASIEAYAAEKVDGVVMTNMDGLQPAASGIEGGAAATVVGRLSSDGHPVKLPGRAGYENSQKCKSFVIFYRLWNRVAFCIANPLLKKWILI